MAGCRDWRACVGGLGSVGGVLACVAWVAGWRACMGSVLLLFSLLLLKHHSEEKNVKYLLLKKKKMLQIDLKF